jgi:hypothetical protein
MAGLFFVLSSLSKALKALSAARRGLRACCVRRRLAAPSERRPQQTSPGRHPHDGGHGRTRRQASDVDATRIDAVLLHHRLCHAGDQGRLAMCWRSARLTSPVSARWRAAIRSWPSRAPTPETICWRPPDAGMNMLGNNAFVFIGPAAFSATGQLHYSGVAGQTVIEGTVGGTLAEDCLGKAAGPTSVQAAFSAAPAAWFPSRCSRLFRGLLAAG